MSKRLEKSVTLCKFFFHSDNVAVSFGGVFFLLLQDCTEEYAFPFRLSKAISKGNPLDGMVEVMCSRILIGQKTMMDIKMEQKEF
ncbi:DNA polymerase epsilon catalytic subunit [Trichinella spiralis]|uniref:DNA polymerase epsilon catalytic subunit n=1 Tax=Trichinella spiralis TaxID=6334 RepID=A0ABR3L1D7_TRISP